jgi:hypothetical protein
MSPTTQEGFFTDEQLDRMNFKTLTNELPEGFDGHQVLALLVTKTKERAEKAEFVEARQSVVDWYCMSKAEEVADEITDYEAHSKLYRLHHEAITMMHSMSNDDWLDFERFMASNKA